VKSEHVFVINKKNKTQLSLLIIKNEIEVHYWNKLCKWH